MQHRWAVKCRKHTHINNNNYHVAIVYALFLCRYECCALQDYGVKSIYKQLGIPCAFYLSFFISLVEHISIYKNLIIWILIIFFRYLNFMTIFMYIFYVFKNSIENLNSFAHSLYICIYIYIL